MLFPVIGFLFTDPTIVVNSYLWSGMYCGLLEMTHGKKSSILHEKLFLLVIYQRLKRLMTEPMLIFLGLETRLDFKYV